MAGIPLTSGFNMNAALPLDLRYVVADNTARDALASGVRFLGLQVFVQSPPKIFYLKTGVTNTDWIELGSGTGGGPSDLDIMAADTAETALITDYTQTGLEILDTPTVPAVLIFHGLKTFRMIHQAASNYSMKKVIAVDPKFRGKNITLSLNNRSTATPGNLTIAAQDETNAVAILASTQLSTDSTTGSFTTTNTSTSATVSAALAALLKVGMSVTGTGIQTGTVINAISGTTVTLSLAATATGTNTLRYSANILKRLVSFDIPLNCASMSFTITALQESGLPETYVDDIVLKITSNTDVSALIVTESDAYLRIAAFTVAYGSTNTKICTIISGAIQNAIGDAIQWLGSASLGDQFIAQKAGIYQFQISTDAHSSGSGGLGFSLNSTALTTDWASIPTAEKIAQSYDAGTGAITCTTAPVYLKVGDIIRIHGDSALSSPSSSRSVFTAAYSGRLKVLNPSSDQKIELGSSELRMEGCSGRGSGSTAVLRFDSIANLRGDAINVLNSSITGTVLTVMKDGWLEIDVNLFGGSGNFVIARNPLGNTSLPSTAAERVGTCTTASTYGNAHWSGKVTAGEIFEIMGNISPTADISNCLVVSHSDNKVGVALSNVTPQFQDTDRFIDINTTNGFGSTATKIYRWVNVAQQDAVGTFSFVQDAVNGDYVQINEDGVYNMWASASGPISGSVSMCFTKNENVASTGTTSGTNLTIAQGLIGTTYGGAPSGNLLVVGCAYNGKLLKGDKIRVHTDGQTNPSAAQAFWNISRAGKPSLTAVDVTPFMNLKTAEYEAITASYNTATFGSTNTAVANWTAISQTNRGVIQVSQSSVLGTTFTVLKACRAWISASGSGNGTGLPGAYITKNETGLIIGAGINNILGYMTGWTNNAVACAAAGVELVPGDVIRIQRDSTNLQAIPSMSILAVADTQSLVSTAKSFRISDLLVAGTRVTGTAPVNLGEYRTYLRNAGAQTFSETNGAPTATPSSANGMRIYDGNAFASADTANQPTRYDIFIGKNKQWNTQFYSTTGRTGIVDASPIIADATRTFGFLQSYDPLTGVLSITALYNSGTETSHFGGKDANSQNTSNVYFDVTIFDTPLVAMNFQRKYAYIREEQASGVSGGTFTAGSYLTRVLNTLVDPSGIVTSLAGNSFTLPAGTYRIRADAPGYAVDSHKAKLRNTTDGSDTLIGQSAMSRNSTAPCPTLSVVNGVFSIPSPKTFQILHRCDTTGSTNGLGVSNTYGDVNVYTMVEIEKLS